MGDTSMIKLGPAEQKLARDGKVRDEKGRSKIVQIFISRSKMINSLQFQYVENGGALVFSDRHGQLTGDDNFHVVRLKYPSEYLTGIRGWTDNFGITSITFHTNLRTQGPFGQPENFDTEFCFELGEDRQFGGFHGTARNSLTSIGVYFKPITTLKAFDESDDVFPF